ncbi:TetR/AcrR family transcriptional regulator [Brevibacterium renqingii]|uniref:TetR/AcrR family transcriptional regulator n=1 Tax=Brevibacterium renqingii TaxID=2776916 RepID=UPI001AE090FC|nr:TetR/AcrR family transcriptional regulator [Brevibacterium renqingii]
MSETPIPRLTRQESQELTRQRLIESAAKLFAEHGVRGTTLIAVAENAGFSRGAVHGNFSDKDELAASVVQFVVEDLGPELDGALSSAGSANDRLAAYISTHIDYCRREPARAAAIIAAVGYLSRPAAAAQSYGQRSADSIADLVALFEDGQRRGEMRSFDPATMALSLRSVLDAAVPTHPSIEASEIIALFDHATRAEEAPQ